MNPGSAFRSCLFLALFFIGLLLYNPFKVEAFTGSGSGTSGSPYLITTCDQFKEIDTALTSYYRLSSSISCASDVNNIMIGGTFRGNFDGASNMITVGISAHNTPNIGLFRNVNGGTISDVTVAGTVKATGTSTSIGSLAGLVAGTSSISDVIVTAAVTGLTDTGGMVGKLTNSSITNSSSTGTVTGSNRTGGLVGQVTCSNITDSFSTSTVNSSNQMVGGLVGRVDCTGTAKSFTRVHATGNVTASSHNVGGLVGFVDYNSGSDDISVIDSYATGNVNSSTSAAGGLVGTNDGTIRQSYSTGSVTSDDYVGGLVGNNQSSGSIIRSYATGSVTENNSFRDGIGIGGLVGINSGTIQDVYAWGAVDAGEPDTVGGLIGESSTGASDSVSNAYSIGVVTITQAGTSGVGGFIGENNYSGDPITASFWNSETAGQPLGCGTLSEDCIGVNSRTTAQLKTQTTYTTDMGGDAWDFSTVWGIHATNNNGYPYFLWQDFVSDDSGSGSNNQSQSSSSISTTDTPTCTDDKPIGSPDLFQITVSNSQAVLYFAPMTSANNYFIAFGRNEGSEEYGIEFPYSNPQGVLSYTINHLSPNTEYFFKIRGGYGCMPGTWSNSMAVKTLNISTGGKSYYKNFLPSLLTSFSE